ncbi:hypothetical protein [Parasitella parasitica]|uniref:Transmembrane protein 14C n=1 Tax=Parasitella parasitica TaxID=35722 RepID=A0A0B7NEE0_9FUNG|nr:hypothetical protein [Parasitella parasitica]
MTDIVGYAYGLTVLAGGLVGFIKAGSLFGVLACLGAYQVSNNPRNATLSLIVSIVLLCVMGGRFYRGRKFMPAGLVTILSLIMVLRYAIRLISK